MAPLELPAHVRWLTRPESYEPRPASVELLQTHISYVLIAGDEVLKLKKAVRFPFLDFSSLEARQRDCEAEVRLNSRSCSDVYLGVVPITRDGEAYSFSGDGETVDYAVRMRRLPAAGMMDAMLAVDAVTPAMIEALIGRLADFHRDNSVDAAQAKACGFEALESNWRRNLVEIQAFAGQTLGQRRFQRLERFAEDRLGLDEELLRRRETEGRIRDGHGDLRSDAVCFRGPSASDICLFDCLEFDQRLRISDVGLEVGFLAMDLEYRGHAILADLLTGLYASVTGDADLTRLGSHFRCYRACVRGLVESLTSRDIEVSPAARREARIRARRYFSLAEGYAQRRRASVLVLTMGASGSGKSFLAGLLASRFDAALLSTDVFRRQVFGERNAGAERDLLDQGRYRSDERDKVYEAILQDCRYRLAKGESVVLDGTYIARRQRDAVRRLAEDLGLRLLVVECEAPPDVIRSRQEARSEQAWSVSEGRWEVYEAQMAAYEPPAEVPEGQRVKVDTTTALTAQLEAVEQALQSVLAGSSSAR